MLLGVDLTTKSFEQEFYLLNEDETKGNKYSLVPISDLGLFTINIAIQNKLEKIVITGDKEMQISMVKDIKNAKNLFLYQPLQTDLIVQSDFEKVTIPLTEVTEEDILRMIQERDSIVDAEVEENEYANNLL